MQKQPQEEVENAEKSQSCEVAASSDVPAMTEEEKVFVFLDFKVDKIKVGRVVIELFKNIAPQACENFRQLCCKAPGKGHTGHPLWYKGTIIHKVVPNFMIQGGDVTHFNGTGGESIYGPTFKDESFEMKMLDVGILGMANLGQPDTNSSQFFISCVPFPHLQNLNVGFGKVRKGFGVVEEISNFPSGENDVPHEKICIEDCGELPADSAEWNYAEDDGLDQYPPYPQDWELSDDLCPEEWGSEVTTAITNIKDSGNQYYFSGNYELAFRKYKKAVRYLSWVKTVREDVHADNATLLIACLSNMAATNLRGSKFRLAHQLCTEVLELRKDAKAYFRRGQANFGLHNYDASLEDLKKAQRLEPRSKQIRDEIKKVKTAIWQYNREEKQLFANMLK